VGLRRLFAIGVNFDTATRRIGVKRVGGAIAKCYERRFFFDI